MRSAQLRPPEKISEILLVDDNRQGLIARKSLLQELGCSVSTATSGDEALNLFRNKKFDIVVTDYKMPRMDGIELIKRSEEHTSELQSHSFISYAVFCLKKNN